MMDIINNDEQLFHRSILYTKYIIINNIIFKHVNQIM